MRSKKERGMLWWREDENDYSELESQAFYWAWADFKPHYALDIHPQDTYFVGAIHCMKTLQ